MHRSESDQAVPCAVCARPVYPGADRGYEIGPTRSLCWQCAVDRGGAYDESSDRWTVAPNVGDLAEEER